jgi:hypothetical protein
MDARARRGLRLWQARSLRRPLAPSPRVLMVDVRLDVPTDVRASFTTRLDLEKVYSMWFQVE